MNNVLELYVKKLIERKMPILLVIPTEGDILKLYLCCAGARVGSILFDHDVIEVCGTDISYLNYTDDDLLEVINYHTIRTFAQYLSDSEIAKQSITRQ